MSLSEAQNRHDWSRLNRIQLGKYAEYLAKMEFVLYGYDVYTSEVDDHGIDFVVRTQNGFHYDVQVKSFRLKTGTTPYIFMPKDRFVVAPSLLLVLVQFIGGESPRMFLIQSALDGEPNPILESRDYGEGKKSAPEWGLTLSKRKLARLAEECVFEASVSKL